MVIRDNPKDQGFTPRKSKDAKFLQKLEGLICRDADHVWWFTHFCLTVSESTLTYCSYWPLPRG
jgi:hypothetical protein